MSSPYFSNLGATTDRKGPEPPSSPSPRLGSSSDSSYLGDATRVTNLVFPKHSLVEKKSDSVRPRADTALGEETLVAESRRACVACAEEIRINAVLCKHCKTRQDDQSFTSPTEIPAEKGISSKRLQTIGILTVAGALALGLMFWGILSAAVSSADGESFAQANATKSSTSTQDTPEKKPEVSGRNTDISQSSPTPPGQKEQGGNSNAQSPGSAQSSRGVESQASELEKQRQEAKRKAEEQLAIWEAESRAKAIQEYEANLSFYNSQIAALKAQKEQVHAEERAAYAQWEARWGFPHNRNSSVECGYTDDMFLCIREHANFPQYWFSISQLDSQIRAYEIQIDYLRYPY